MARRAAPKVAAGTALPHNSDAEGAFQALTYHANPPVHVGFVEKLVKLNPNQPAAIRNSAGVFVSPGEVAWVPTADADAWIAGGKATLVQ